MDATADAIPQPTAPAAHASRLRRAQHVRNATRLGVSLVDQACVSGANFVTGVIVGRTCTKAEFGLYGMAVAGLLLLAELHNALVAVPHQVLYPKTAGVDRRRFNGSTLVHSLSLGVAAGLTLLTVGLAVVGAGATETGEVLLVLSVTAWAILARNYARLFSFTTLRPARALTFDAGIAALQVGMLLLLACTGHLGTISAVATIGGANALAMAAWLVRERGDFDMRLAQARADWHRTWPLSRLVFVSGVLFTLGIHLYPWLVGGLRSAEEAGIWTACFGIGAVANPLLMGVQNALGPAVAHAHARLDAHDFRRYVLRASVAFGLLMAPFAVAAAVFGDAFLRLYGNDYHGDGHIVGLLALASVVAAAGFPVARGLFAERRARHDLIGNVVTIAMLLALGLWLIRAHGVIGAAASLLISVLAGTTYRVVAFAVHRHPTNRGESPL